MSNYSLVICRPPISLYDTGSIKIGGWRIVSGLPQTQVKPAQHISLCC